MLTSGYGPASEVKMSLLSSKRSERDTIRGGQLKIGYVLYACLYGFYVAP